LKKGKTFNSSYPAVVLGALETGLGVIRSLGQEGIRVYCFDFKTEIARYSRFGKFYQCPHPQKERRQFIEFLLNKGKLFVNKAVLFFASDYFIKVCSENRDLLRPYYLFNWPDDSVFKQIGNKYEQYLLATNADICMPKTIKIDNIKNLILPLLSFPLIMKGIDVVSWRNTFGGSKKGFILENLEQLNEKLLIVQKQTVPVVLQEIIKGPDTNHFKYCAYISSEGKTLAEFTLRKIRQLPIRYGVGAVVESFQNKDLLEVGRKFFKGIAFKGIGSAEFKLDENDGKLKLIELNPRYWLQNYLSTATGINFALLNYLDITDQNPIPLTEFKTEIKWINRYMDFDSFLGYRKERKLTFRQWRKSLKGKKVYSDFLWGDPLPALYEIRFGLKIFRIPRYLLRRIL
jgi:D-aspartate ligase